MAQRDVVLRWLAELALVVRRLLYGPGEADLDLAAESVDAAMTQLLGPLAPLVPRLDVASTVTLLHDPERIFACARLLALQGAVEHARGESGARATHARALELARAALRLGGEVPEEWTAWVAEAEAWP